MLLTKFFQIGHAGHSAVVLHYLADDAGGFQTGQAREIDAALGLPGAHEHPAVARAKWKDIYKDGIIPKPEEYAHAYPDLLTFHDAATPIETTLHEMHLEHRMRTFQGTFHANPDYALWYGWAAMKKDLTEIKHLDKEMRAEAAR